MPSKGLFITGTDTGVGKTVVSAALLTWLRSRGIRTGVMKPAETGVDPECSSAANSDALFLMECGKVGDDLSEVSPIRLKPAASPYQASLIENRIIDPSIILSAFRTLTERHDWMIVEGVGGVRVPITREYEVLHLMKDLGLPAVIVSRYRVGTLNHTLMTLDSLKKEGVPIKGVVFNETGPDIPDAIEQDQPSLIKALSDIPVLGTMPGIQNLNTQSFTSELLNQIDESICFSKWVLS